MFARKETPKYQKLLESELEYRVSTLRNHLSGSDEYARDLAHVERLYEMLGKDNKQPRISPEARATIAANLIGILMIIKHERVNVITSKALAFVVKPRI